jgi:hypothetical protein
MLCIISMAIYPRQTTLQQCSQLCQADPLCQSWTFYSSGTPANSCYANYETPEYVTYIWLLSQKGTKICASQDIYLLCSFPSNIRRRKVVLLTYDILYGIMLNSSVLNTAQEKCDEGTQKFLFHAVVDQPTR